MDERGGRCFCDGSRIGERERDTETKYTYMTASSSDKYVKERKRAARDTKSDKERERKREREREMRMSYNNRTRSQRSVCKRAISNRRNTRRKVNPRTGWSTHTSSLFVVHGLFHPFVSRSLVNGLCAPESLSWRQNLPRAVHSTPRSVWTRSVVSIYTYACPPHVYIFGAYVYARDKVHASACTHTRSFAPANTYCRIYHHRVLYNAAIDSRPLFHARDLLQSLQPVSGDSLQCPVSLPVSVHKIYFPRRYTGCRGENRTRAPVARTENPALRIHAPDMIASNDCRAFSGRRARSKRKYYLVT